jgi:hypothetical protein
MTTPSKYPTFIYERTDSEKRHYKAVYFIKKNLYLVEDKDYNFGECSQRDEKVYLTTKELNDTIVKARFKCSDKLKYKLADDYHNKEDCFIKFDNFLTKYVWKQEDSEEDSDDE